MIQNETGVSAVPAAIASCFCINCPLDWHPSIVTSSGRAKVINICTVYVYVLFFSLLAPLNIIFSYMYTSSSFYAKHFEMQFLWNMLYLIKFYLLTSQMVTKVQVTDLNRISDAPACNKNWIENDNLKKRGEGQGEGEGVEDYISQRFVWTKMCWVLWMNISSLSEREAALRTKYEKSLALAWNLFGILSLKLLRAENSKAPVNLIRTVKPE